MSVTHNQSSICRLLDHDHIIFSKKSSKFSKVNPIDIKSNAKHGKILSTANIQDCRNHNRAKNWMYVAEKMSIGDCVVFDDKHRAQNFYGSSRRVGIWLARYVRGDVIAYTRYE